MIDRKAFYAAVRVSVFGGYLFSETVSGIDAILDEWERRKLKDKRWLAYMLGTVYRECGARMLPVREGFSASDAAARAFVRRQGYKYATEVNGQVYYGRGLVQLTWTTNYKKMADLLEVDLLAKPDLALEPPIASKIMFEGMIRGTFTGKSLALYFNDHGEDWISARRVINGLDHAGDVAEVAQKFNRALREAGEIVGAVPLPKPKPAPPTPATPPRARSWVDILLSVIRRKA